MGRQSNLCRLHDLASQTPLSPQHRQAPRGPRLQVQDLLSHGVPQERRALLRGSPRADSPKILAVGTSRLISPMVTQHYTEVHLKHSDGHIKEVPYFCLPTNELVDVIAPSCYRFNMEQDITYEYFVAIRELQPILKELSCLTRCGCEYFKWLDPELTDRATIVINGLLRKLDRMKSEKRLQDELNG
ncbi:hypothetical protein Syun_001067 [Stephania yunnanensis]|uniref:Uncharacterized protein n=1 Tax=Stephania yunnanensis TaxID=152371 RepID=A0AAP0LD10_9MAGN